MNKYTLISLLLILSSCTQKPLNVANPSLKVANPNTLDRVNSLDVPITRADFEYCEPTEQTQGHPHPQFRLPSSTQTTAGDTTTIVTAETCISEPVVDAFTLPPGTNLLANVSVDMVDGSGKVMPNTLPSTPTIPYNLHDGQPIVTEIDQRSPNDDLLSLLAELDQQLATDAAAHSDEINTEINNAIAILEGTFPNRSYSGFPVLHFNGPDKLKRVNKATKVVKVHQIWYDEHIESDTSFIDPSEVLEEPWIIEYTIDVLNRGEDDFSPFVMYTDDPALTDPNWHHKQYLPGRGRLDNIGMDQTFFPMQDGTRTVFRIKMTPGKYLNLTYAWGWRMHPPRIQAIENALKSFPATPAPTEANPFPGPAPLQDTKGNNIVSRKLHAWEVYVFGEKPSQNHASRAKAIGYIGNLAPAKRMWNAFRLAARKQETSDWPAVIDAIKLANDAYFDWRTRSKLPSGVTVDPDSDITLLYVNNTIYAEFSDEGPLKFPEVRWSDWKKRDTTLKVKLHNGDYFQHAYLNVDFGGARGWENQFKSSIRVGGSGCWFTFGRAHWMINNKPVVLAAAAQDSLETEHHQINITYHYEPSTRLRFYQFDPMHHDVAIYSVH